jgi:hypothetical protein
MEREGLSSNNVAGIQRLPCPLGMIPSETNQLPQRGVRSQETGEAGLLSAIGLRLYSVFFIPVTSSEDSPRRAILA